MARPKIVFKPVEDSTPEERAEWEKHGVFVGPLTDAELESKSKAWEATLRWPPRRVETGKFAAFPYHERLYQLATGNIQSSRSLCVELGEQPDLLSWPRGAVVYYLTHLSVELFLKACLIRGGGQFDKIHEISQLQDSFQETFPNLKGIRTIWDINVVDPVPVNEDQFLRYFDSRLPRRRSMYSFAPAVFIVVIEDLEAEFKRVWEAVGAQAEGQREGSAGAGAQAAADPAWSR